ncbi:hypothetical protein GCM10009550_76900 [Actinocorallia libanotica]|uniref:Uncharacterized protein n=1 Tax=Actinocorallia libanotica TaxID=46162 RepID=A0ABP4CI91_9ACTN
MSWNSGGRNEVGSYEPPVNGEPPMTSTTRWTIAQRRKRLVISQTLRDRAQTDPRRSAEREKDASSS